MDVVPGRGIDLDALRDTLLLVLGLYVLASLFTWLQGYTLNHVTQRTVKRLRTEVQDKLARIKAKDYGYSETTTGDGRYQVTFVAPPQRTGRSVDMRAETTAAPGRPPARARSSDGSVAIQRRGNEKAYWIGNRMSVTPS